MRAWVMGAAIGLCCVGLSMGQNAAASVRRPVNIPAQDLAIALQTFAKSTGVHLVYLAEDVRARHTAGASGELTPDETLSRLLGGTGLSYSHLDADTVTISPITQHTPDASGTDASPPQAAVRPLQGRLLLAQQGAPPVALSQPLASPGASEIESITVTGSRVISNMATSPTPVTEITADQLQATTPSDIADSLRKLPDFVGGNTPQFQAGPGSNGSGNTLSLRGLGAQRTLVLVDGRRVVPSNSDGTVDINTLPQILMSRVDVVTGGASAIYGSDAVAGVVNFILDKNFDGFKYDINGGTSTYGDPAQQRLGMAWGTGLFGGRGHYEVAARYFNQGLVPVQSRPYGSDDWIQTGSGTAANPYVNVPNGRINTRGQNGLISCGANCSFADYTFTSGGNIRPMSLGTPTTTTNAASGGDGGVIDFSTLRAAQTQYEFFNRFSYDITSSVNAYVQASWSQAGTFSRWNTPTIASGNYFTTNPFLSSAVQAALTTAATGTHHFVPAPVVTQNGSIAPAVAADTPYFTDSSGVNGGPGQDELTIGENRKLSLTTGVTAKLGGFNLDLYYSHQENQLHVDNPNNFDKGRLLAAQDAVLAPAGTKINGVNVGGTIQCWDETQAAYSALYKGCVPLNAFDPSQGISQSVFDYIKNDTFWTLTQKLDDADASISGGLFGLGLPAGEITGALSFEMRWRTYDMQSNANPNDTVDCTGLRLCTTSSTAPATNFVVVNAPISVADNVWEAALEFNVPLLKDAPLARELNADIAGRYTDYSVSGVAKTWKIGLNDNINGAIRLRGTASLDIRAPNLNDLYQPLSKASTGLTDLVTGVSGGTTLYGQGNAALSPEQAHTYTMGVVLTPNFLSGFTASLDYYQTHMTNAISSVSFQTASIQQLCVNSAPAYDSQYCTLAVRPIAPGQAGYASTSNFPTQIYSEPFNTAVLRTKGWDLEADYSFDWAGGRMNLRHLATYQPVSETQSIPGATWTWTIQPKTRMTTFLNYSVGGWSLDLENYWLSRMMKATSAGVVYASPWIPSYDSLDVTVSREFRVRGGTANVYFSVQNIGNTLPPLWPATSSASVPGLYYPTPGNANSSTVSYSALGRYFTIGLRGTF